MALTHANNTLKAPDPVKASAHIRVILALALCGTCFVVFYSATAPDACCGI